MRQSNEWYREIWKKVMNDEWWKLHWMKESLHQTMKMREICDAGDRKRNFVPKMKLAKKTDSSCVEWGPRGETNKIWWGGSQPSWQRREKSLQNDLYFNNGFSFSWIIESWSTRKSCYTFQSKRGCRNKSFVISDWVEKWITQSCSWGNLA